jgi:inorganic pyrophosphatase
MYKRKVVEAIVEMPSYTRYKYEQSKKDGVLVLDRVLSTIVPYNYGFIPGTLCDDGDPLDIFVVSNEPIPSLARVKVEIIGGFKCTDNGFRDDKLIGILIGDKISGCYSVEIAEYLTNYKKDFIVKKYLTVKEAGDTYVKSKRQAKGKSSRFL